MVNGTNVEGRDLKSGVIHIFRQNVQGFNFDKKNRLELLLLENVNVICLTQHWQKENHLKCLNILNFNLTANYCRPKMERGGSCVFTKVGLKTNILCKFQNLNTEKHVESSIVQLVDYNLIII